MKEITIKNNKITTTIYLDNNLDKFSLAMQQHKLQNNSKLFVIIDNEVLKQHNPTIKTLISGYNCLKYEFNTSSTPKDNKAVDSIYDFLMEGGADSDSVIVGIGGITVIDLAAFCSSTFKGGIPVILLPTTLSSQVDECLKVKYSYNYKNVRGAISNSCSPVFVYIAINFLHTRNNQEFVNGIIRITNYALLKDITLLNFMDENYKHIFEGENDKLLHIIKEGLKIKEELYDEGNICFIGKDFGRILESNFKENLSKEAAIALGMLISLKLSELKFQGNSINYNKLRDLFIKVGLPTKFKIDDLPSFIDATKNIKFMILDNGGVCQDKAKIEGKDITLAIKESIMKEN